MLKPEDCVPGTKVICIAQDSELIDILNLGAIYTVNEYSSVFWGEFTNRLIWNTVSVKEIPFTIEDKFRKGEKVIPFFDLTCFKLLETKQTEEALHKTKELEDA